MAAQSQTIQDLSRFSDSDLAAILGGYNTSLEQISTGIAPQLTGLEQASALPSNALVYAIQDQPRSSGGGKMGINYNVSAPQGTMQIQPWQYAYETEMMNRYDPFMSQVRGYQTPQTWLQQRGGPEAFDPGLAAQNQLLQSQAASYSPWQQQQELSRWQTTQQSDLARALQEMQAKSQADLLGQKLAGYQQMTGQYMDYLTPLLGQYGITAGGGTPEAVSGGAEPYSLSNVEMSPIQQAYEQQMRGIGQSMGRGGGGQRSRAYQQASAGQSMQSAIADAITGISRANIGAGLTQRGQNIGLIGQALQALRPSLSFSM